jgi:hypothetical protein
VNQVEQLPDRSPHAAECRRHRRRGAALQRLKNAPSALLCRNVNLVYLVAIGAVAAATRVAGGNFRWRDAPQGWQRALRQLTVVLISDWGRLGLARV